MKQLNKPSDNLGGLLKMWAIPADVITLTGTSLIFSDTSDIVQLSGSPGTMSVEEQTERTTSGIHYNTSISVFIPGDSPEIRSAMLDMQGRKFVVLLLDGNENYKLSGGANYPLRMNSTMKSGMDESQRPGYEVQFTGKTILPSVFVNNPF